jgi:hypothetical protein
MTTGVGSLASLHRYPMKSMMAEALKYTSPPAAGSAAPPVRVMLPDGEIVRSVPARTSHSTTKPGLASMRRWCGPERFELVIN